MNWAELKQADPELAYLGEDAFRRTGLVLIGTLRRNGWPRISPVEPLIVEGALYLGMSWHSRKALDLLRDGGEKITVHSAVCNRDGSEGDFKLYGRAVDVQSPEERAIYAEALHRELGYDLADVGQFHLFAVDIESVAHVVIEGGEQKVKVWPI